MGLARFDYLLLFWMEDDMQVTRCGVPNNVTNNWNDNCEPLAFSHNGRIFELYFSGTDRKKNYSVHIVVRKNVHSFLFTLSNGFHFPGRWKRLWWKIESIRLSLGRLYYARRHQYTHQDYNWFILLDSRFVSRALL